MWKDGRGAVRPSSSFASGFLLPQAHLLSTKKKDGNASSILIAFFPPSLPFTPTYDTMGARRKSNINNCLQRQRRVYVSPVSKDTWFQSTTVCRSTPRPPDWDAAEVKPLTGRHNNTPTRKKKKKKDKNSLRSLSSYPVL